MLVTLLLLILLRGPKLNNITQQKSCYSLIVLSGQLPVSCKTVGNTAHDCESS